MKCKNCGADLEADNKFCEKCGASVEEEAIVIKKCIGCGAELEKDAEFCIKCGMNIKEGTNKVAKDVSFGLLLFDKNGYPVDVEYTIYQGTHENEFNCEFGSCNVTPGSSYGGNRYFSLPDNCKKVKACVRSVEYTDGTRWSNPYYDYWLKQNYSSY